MKNNAIIRIILFSIAIVVLAGILVIGLLVGMFMNKPDAGVVNAEEENETTLSYGAEQVKDISIEWAAGSITIQPGEVDAIVVTETGRFSEDKAMVCTLSGDKLTIRYSKTQVYFGISFEGSKDLTITVPRDWSCNELEIDAASAKVTARDLTIQEADFDGASGTCDFENCRIGQFDVDTASGNVRLSGTLEELDFSGASGDCTLVLTNVPRRIDLDAASGDLDVTLPAGAGFSVSLDSLSGDFTSDFETTLRDGNYLCGDGSCRINVSAASGDVIIRKGE